MTELLEKAFAAAAELPEDEQNFIASQILKDVEEEKRWQETFAKDPDKLRRLEERALAEVRAGRTEPMDFSRFEEPHD